MTEVAPPRHWSPHCETGSARGNGRNQQVSDSGRLLRFCKALHLFCSNFKSAEWQGAFKRLNTMWSRSLDHMAYGNMVWAWWTGVMGLTVPQTDTGQGSRKRKA